MKKLLLGLFALVAVITLVGCQTENTSVFDFILDETYTEFIVMGTSADYPPYEWLHKNEEGKTELVGFDVELGKEIAKALGKNLRVINRGFDFLLEDLKNGKMDFVISGMTPNAERELEVDFSMNYYTSSQAVVINKADINTFNSVESLNIATVKVGAQLGSIQQDLADAEFVSAQKLYLQSVNDLLFNLQQDKVDAIVLETPVAEGFISNDSNFVLANIAIGEPEGGSAVAVQNGDAELLAKINEVIAALIANGQMDQFVKDAIILNS